MTRIFLDTFDYASWPEMEAAGWYLRNPEYATTGERTMTKSDPAAIGLGDGALTLKVRKDPDNPGKHFVGHVAVRLPFTYGTMTARMQFGRPAGAHGAFWHQSGYTDGGAELDIVEFFGERNPNSEGIQSQRVQHTVHVGPFDEEGKTVQKARFTWTDKDTDVSSLPSYQGLGEFGLNRTWWYAEHDYECTWDPSGYVFRVDGVLVGKTILPAEGFSARSASRPGELILSNLSKDGEERDDLLRHVATAEGRYSDFDVRISRVEVTQP